MFLTCLLHINIDEKGDFYVSEIRRSGKTL